MLMTFRSDAAANITMFGSVGLQLVDMMGYPNTKNGAIRAENISDALNRLQAGLDNGAETHPTHNHLEDNEDEAQTEEPVSLGHRAVPLIDMLKAAIKDECGIMWESK